MSDLFRLIWCVMVGLARTRAALQAEILVLRHQLNVLRRKSPKRAAAGNIDRLLFVGLYRFSPKVLDALKILKTETVVLVGNFRLGHTNGVIHLRLAGALGRDRLDHLVIFGEQHLRHMLNAY
jgi:hypothetical protein